MFIWLASYPKSGNTLVRSLIASYFFSNDGVYNFSLIKNIKQFPNIKLFEDLGIDIKNEREVIANYIRVQQSFNKKKSTQFLKTHSYLFNIENNAFTDLNNSLGVIYIVRDPRNVVTSFANHNSISVNESSELLINSWFNKGILNSFSNAERTNVYRGTWASNYKSWKSFKSQGRYLLIKYEDLIINKEEVLLKMLRFIYKLNKKNFEVNKVKLKNAIVSTSFERMKALEKDDKFFESIINKKTGKKVPFFNLGIKNDWKKMLDPKIKEKIENAFKEEMKELGYL
ncbi:sulfotransferase domain-containing protein [Candidatus Pelagibacter ubique]|nr:sulfotransferase domain-containing protein [Candidatus Pelagibacter ubique]